MDADDTNLRYFVWEINSAAAQCKETKALGAETIYVPGADSVFAGATYVGASSAASGNGFVHIAPVGIPALMQTDASALFIVTPIMTWPRLAVAEGAGSSDWLSSRSAQDGDLQEL
jgi:hypothetical protein